MSLIRRGRYYWLDIRLGGKRIRRSLHTTHKTIALARYGEKREELESELGGAKVRFADFCDKYLEWAWSSKPLSALREEQRLRKVRAFFGDLKIVFLDDITPYHVEQLKIKLSNEKLSKTTINMYLQLLRGMIYKAIDWEIYHKPNPMKKIRFFRRERPIQGLSEEELMKVLEEAKRISEKPRSKFQKLFYDLCIFALNTGMRRSEILNLSSKDIKSDFAIVKGKGGKTRMIPLNKIAIDIIQKQPRRSEYIFNIKNRNSATLFVKTTDRIKRETEVDFHFHLLRHSFTTSLVERGIDFITIGSILGHSKTTMSMLYSHTSEEKKKKAVSLLE